MKSRLTFLSITLAISLLVTGCNWNPFGGNQEPTPTPTEAPENNPEEISQLRQELEQATGQTLPTAAPAQPEGQAGEQVLGTNVEETILRDQSGGNSRGYVTVQQGDQQAQVTVLADLPDLESGQFYQVWTAQGEQGSEGYQVNKLQRLSPQKGGYVLDMSSAEGLGEANQIIVSRETTSTDQPSDVVLSGQLPQ